VRDRSTAAEYRVQDAWLIAVTTLFWVTAVLVLYEPFAARPLELLDFSEFLPFLREEGSFGTRLSRFLEYYAQRGRVNIGSYALFIVNYSLWGDNPVGWQLSRVIQFRDRERCSFWCFGASAPVPSQHAPPACSQCARRAPPTHGFELQHQSRLDWRCPSACR
jgi:hypothetical protein